MAFAVLLSALVTTGVASAASWILDSLGWGSAATVVARVLGILVAFVIDAATFLLIVWVLAGERPAWWDLRWGAIIAGIGIGVVRILGTTVVAGSVSRNPLFTSVAVIVTLLVWINLIARIVLLAAAWTANPPLVEPPPGKDGPAAG
jgi:membrane protein